MAIFKQFLYTNTGTEIDFMQGLIDLICGLDEDITVEDADGNPTTVAAQYADLTSASTANFYFNFGNGQKMRLRRNFANNAGCRNFVLYGRNSVLYSLNDLGVIAEGTRSFLIVYLKSENFIALWIGAYNDISIANTKGSALVLKTANDRFANAQYDINVLNYALVGSDTTVTYSPLFQYAQAAGNVDFIDHAAFVSGGVKAFDSEELYSCSTVPQWSTILLGNGRTCFAIAANALVPLDEEE